MYGYITFFMKKYFKSNNVQFELHVQCHFKKWEALPMSPGVSHRLKELQCFWQR